MNRSRAAEHRENARLTQIMKAYAEKKGAEYLMRNEHLKQTAASELMEQSYEQGRETVRCGTGRCHRRRMIRRVLSAAAVIVLCLMVVTATALAVSPELRERVFRLFVERDGSFSLGETLEADIDPEVIYHYSDPIVPEGYTDMEEDRPEDNICYTRAYYYPDGSTIVIYIITAAGNNSWGGPGEEPNVQEPVTIHDFEGYYEEYSFDGLDGDSLMFRLADTTHGAYIRVSGYGADITRETLQSIAEQLYYVGG